MYWTKAGTPATYFINKNNAALGKSMPSGLSGLSKLVMFSLSILKILKLNNKLFSIDLEDKL